MTLSIKHKTIIKMKNSELQTLLKQYPDDMSIKLLLTHSLDKSNMPIDLDEENILHTSVTAYCDNEAPQDEWDSEDGKVILGDGEQYLLINPIIV